MKPEAPPTLQKLAELSLMKVESLVISVLEDLPTMLFPRLFKYAFTRRKINILRNMVAAWPFSCLPLGSLMKTPDLETLKAVLHGLDDLLEVKVPPRRSKLQVLDLRDVNQNFWNGGGGAEDKAIYPQVTNQKQNVVNLPESGVKMPLQVLLDLGIKFYDREETSVYLLDWLWHRRDSVQLCYWKLKLCPLPLHSSENLLDIVKQDSIQELELSSRDDEEIELYESLKFMHLMKCTRKKNLRSLHWFESSYPEEICAGKLMAQFSKFTSLRHLCIKGVCFGLGCLEEMLGVLKTPLETLAITHCILFKCDWYYLSSCPSIGQLKHLDLSGLKFSFSDYSSLHILLDRVTGTLQTLDMEGCVMEDTSLYLLLPALKRCSQLTRLNLYDNNISMPVLKDLLYQTASLSQLTLEMYPAPLECYVDDLLDRRRFAENCPQLMDTLRAIREPKTVSFASTPCFYCRKRCVYNPRISTCHCQKFWLLKNEGDIWGSFALDRIRRRLEACTVIHGEQY